MEVRHPAPAAALLFSRIALMRVKSNNKSMDSGQIILIYSRLILGALAAFLAIILWSKTKNAFWMLMVAAVIIAYIETIYSILEMLGIITENFLFIGSISLVAILLPVLRMIFLISAFLVMIIKQYRQQ